MKIKRLFSVITIAALLITSTPILSGTLDSDAATGLRASSSQSSVSLRWTKLTKKQQKKVKGIAVFRNGAVVANISKKASSYTDNGLTSGTLYSYQVKSYTTKTAKTKMWFNKATGQWQKKKPAKAIRGKSKKVKTVIYKYKNVTSKTNVTTTAAPVTSSPANDPSENSPSEGVNISIYSIQAFGSESITKPYISLFWTTSKNVSCSVYRDGAKISDCPASACSYTDNNVSWSETHSYQVKAVYNGKTYSSETKSATVPDQPNTDPVYVDVSNMYTYVNQWRQDPNNHWITYNGRSPLTTEEVANLVTLQKDTTLEAVAKQRAKEQYEVNKYGNGKPHTRPDGKSWSVTYHEFGLYNCSECLAYGSVSDQKAIICGNSSIPGWAEDNGYANQGHRRLMLGIDIGTDYVDGEFIEYRRPIPYNKVGFACYKVGAVYTYTMALGY